MCMESFQSTLNQDGVVKIGGDIYVFTEEKELIIFKGNITKLKAVLANPVEDKSKDVYVFSRNLLKDTNARIPGSSEYGTLAQTTVTNGTLRGIFSFHYDYFVTLVRDPVTTLPQYWTFDNNVYYQSSGQQKILAIWTSYATDHYIDNLDFSSNDQINGYKFKHIAPSGFGIPEFIGHGQSIIYPLVSYSYNLPSLPATVNPIDVSPFTSCGHTAGSGTTQGCLSWQ